MSRSLLVGLVALATQAEALPKILCLHGGGGNAEGFAAQAGMRALGSDLRNEFEFVFANAAYGDKGRVWMRDPPGGKDEPTTDPSWADESLFALDRIVEEQGKIKSFVTIVTLSMFTETPFSRNLTQIGPFYGILGYSQGSAFVPAYLAHAPEGTFEVALAFCGYLPDTHLGILDNIGRGSPYGDIPSLVWLGANDFIISNPMTYAQVEFFKFLAFSIHLFYLPSNYHIRSLI